MQKTPNSKASSSRGSKSPFFTPLPSVNPDGDDSPASPPSFVPGASHTPTPPSSAFVFGEARSPKPTPHVPRAKLPAISIWDRLSKRNADAPTPAVINFGEGDANPTAFTFVQPESATRPRECISSSIDGGSSSLMYALPSTSFVSGHERSSTPTFLFNHTPSFTSIFKNGSDHPLPSIERDVTPNLMSRRGSSSDPTIPTPSSMRRPTLRQSSGQPSLREGFQSTRISSPDYTTRNEAIQGHKLPHTSSKPSIRVTPTPSTPGFTRSESDRGIDSLNNGIGALRMDLGWSPSPAQNLNANPSGGSVNGSPSPSPRRQSGPGMGQRKHKVEDEEPPQALYYEKDTQNAISDAECAMTQVSGVLSSSNLHCEDGSIIQKLYEKTVTLKKFKPPSSRKIGLVGDAGLGKSSLVNSLLDTKNLARSGGKGAACTCVATEYHYHDREDFLIHVEYFTSAELRTQFEELLQAYRAYKSPPSDTRAEDLDDLRCRHDLAKHTFEASFREKLQYTPEVLDFLPIDKALDLMTLWTTQLLPQQGTVSDLWEKFDDIEQCSSRLIVLTSENEKSRCKSLWPLIRKIRVYLKAHILSQGLIIADLPGLRDLNSSRQNITERYVRECHEILAVARIGRVITDPGIKNVFELARLASLTHVGIVCTMSDDINADEAREDWNSERAFIDRHQKLIEDAESEVQYLKPEIDDFDSDFSNLSKEEVQELARLQHQYKKAQESKALHEFELKRHIIDVRNRSVIASLQDNYRNHPLGAELKVFCVSNTIYWDNRKQNHQRSLPFLQLSGIIELRRYCIGIVADSHLRCSMKYIKDEIPAFLGSLELWVQAGSGNASAERKQRVLNTVTSVQQQLDQLTSPTSPIADMSRTMNRDFKKKILVQMKEHERKWSCAAKKASLEWQSWHAGSYSAFCRKHGKHGTKNIKSRCWNDEATSEMTSYMKERWGNFNDEMNENLEQILDSVDTAFENMIEQIGLENTVDALTTLTMTLRRRQDLVIDAAAKVVELFQSKILSLETNAFSSISTSFMYKILDPIYCEANKKEGSGSDSQKKSVITSGFSNPEVFRQHRQLFEEEFRRHSEELQSHLQQVIQRHTSSIVADLDMLRSEHVVHESERNPKLRGAVEVELKRTRVSIDKAWKNIEGLVSAAQM